jgi:hypothetical protein
MAVNSMSYRSDEIGVAQMFDELVAKDHTRFDAAVELGQALNDGKIILWYAGEPVVSDLPAIGNWLRDFVSDPKQAWLGYGYLVPTLEKARALRIQFETVCGLVEQDRQGAQIVSSPSDPTSLRLDVVRKALGAGMNPPSTITWKAFCDRVRDDADGWVDKKEGTLKRGFDEKTIKRDVEKILSLN